VKLPCLMRMLSDELSCVRLEIANPTHRPNRESDTHSSWPAGTPAPPSTNLAHAHSERAANCVPRQTHTRLKRLLSPQGLLRSPSPWLELPRR
jgi:hypothetical protein